MGNVLKAAKEKLTLEQFKEYLLLLKGVTYKLLLKRHIDVAVEMNEKIQKDDIDYLDGNTAGAVLANIRFKNNNELVWQYEGIMPTVSEYNCEVDFTSEIMDTSPKNWTIGRLVAGMGELEKCRIEYFGEASPDTPPTSAERRAATVQATLAVFKSIFSHLPEQTAPAAATEPQENGQNTLPPECRKSSKRPKRGREENIGKIVERLQEGYKQNKTFGEIVNEISQERKLREAAEAKLRKRIFPNYGTETDTEEQNQPETTPAESSSNDTNLSTGKNSSTKSKKSSKKRKSEETKSEETKTNEELSLSNPSLDLNVVKTVESEPTTETNNGNEASSSSLDIPIAVETKPKLIFSDALSEAFSPNPVSVLSKTGHVAGTPNDSDSLDNINLLDLPQNSDSELLEDDDELSEPDDPEPLLN